MVGPIELRGHRVFVIHIVVAHHGLVAWVRVRAINRCATIKAEGRGQGVSRVAIAFREIDDGSFVDCLHLVPIFDCSSDIYPCFLDRDVEDVVLALQVGCTSALRKLHSSIHLLRRDIVDIAIGINAHYVDIVSKGVAREDEGIGMGKMMSSHTTNVRVSCNIALIRCYWRRNFFLHIHVTLIIIV